ncbi:MAG: cache domain-containing protein, partial [Lachnospiraceae bacterium]|nr:cache domain-containing protein [Lachnospiraceae bacterium]
MKVVRKKKLIFRIIFIALAAIILVSVSLVLIGAIEIKSAYFSMVNEELKIASIQMEEEVDVTYDGDWGGDDYTAVFKGMQLINDEYTEMLDLAHANTGVDYTLFFGKTRAVTTLKDSSGQRIVGTDASGEVVTKVLTNGQHYYSDNLTINGKKYCAYYVPIKNSDGSIIGMMFAGRPVDDVTQKVLRAIIIMTIVAAAIVGLILVLGCVVANKTSKKMSAIADQLEKVAGGDLSVRADETLLSRKDELGKIAEALNLLTDKLGAVISETKSMSLNIGNAGSELSCSSN